MPTEKDPPLYPPRRRRQRRDWKPRPPEPPRSPLWDDLLMVAVVVCLAVTLAATLGLIAALRLGH